MRAGVEGEEGGRVIGPFDGWTMVVMVGNVVVGILLELLEGKLLEMQLNK